MASIVKRPNGAWRCRIVGPDGKQRSRDFPTKKLATDFAADQRVKMRDGTWIDPRRLQRTFGDYSARWVEGRVHVRETSAAMTESRLRTHLLPRWGRVPLVAIERSDVQSWVAALTDTLAPRTVKGVYGLFATIMRAAVDDHMIPASPCRKINLPAAEGRLVIPTEDQVAAVLEHACPQLRAMVLLAVGTGMRISEMAGLSSDRVDFLRGVVTVDRQMLTPSNSGRPAFAPPKTKASVREIPVADELVEALALHLEEHGPNVDGLLFVNRYRKPYRRNSLEENWHGWHDAAKVADPAHTPFKWHHLRHFYASALIADGQSPVVVQRRLGHSSIETTLGTYGHLWPEDDDRTRMVTAALLGRVSRETSTSGGATILAMREHSGGR